MAKQIIVVALILFAAAVVSASTSPSAAPSAAPTTSTPSTPGTTVPIWTDGPTSSIGTITGGPAVDAAPVGGPVPDGVFPDLTPAPAPDGPSGGAAAIKVTGAVAAAGLVGSLFFF